MGPVTHRSLRRHVLSGHRAAVPQPTPLYTLSRRVRARLCSSPCRAVPCLQLITASAGSSLRALATARPPARDHEQPWADSRVDSALSRSTEHSPFSPRPVRYQRASVEPQSPYAEPQGPQPTVCIEPRSYCSTSRTVRPAKAEPNAAIVA